MSGIARRSWARNPHAMETAFAWNLENRDRGQITLPYLSNDTLLDNILEKYMKKN